MSALPNILPMAGADALKDDGAMNFPSAPDGTPGQFDELMKRALSPSPNGSVAPSGQNQPPQIPAQKFENQNIYPHQMPGSNHAMATGSDVTMPSKHGTSNPQTSGKIAAKSDDGTSETKGKQSAQTDTVSVAINPEIIANQILAAIDCTVNPIGKSNTGKGSQPSSPHLRAGTAVTTPVVMDVSTGTKQITTPAMKASIPDLATSQIAAAVRSLTVDQMNSITPAKVSIPNPSEDQIKSAVPALAPDKANSIATQAAGLPAKNPEIPSTVDQTTADSSKAKFAAETERPSSMQSDLSSKIAVPAQSNTSGISIATIAKQDIPMKQAEKTNKIAGTMEQVLPGNVGSAARENSSLLISPRPEQFTTTVAVNSSTTANADLAAPLPVDSTASSATTDARVRMLERTQDMVTLNAMRLSDSGNNSLQVIIKPGAGTELSLELRQHGDSVEVQAVLQRGDYNHLSQQWPDLQQRLDQRGIRLAPLTDDGASANNSGSETFQQKQNQPAEAAAEFAFASSPNGVFAPETVSATAHRGWETWA